MLKFDNLEEMKPYFDEKSNTYRFKDDVWFRFDLCVDSNINAWNINAWNINALNINAWNINAENIDAGNIDAGNINAWNIDAGNINAEDINYYAVCIAYQKFICRSVRGSRKNAIHACLDGQIEYRDVDESNEKND